MQASNIWEQRKIIQTEEIKGFLLHTWTPPHPHQISFVSTNVSDWDLAEQRMRSSRVWMRSSRLWMISNQVWLRSSQVCMRSSRVLRRSSRLWMISNQVWMRYIAEYGWDLADCGCWWDLAECGWDRNRVWMRSSWVWMRSSRVWMRLSRAVNEI